MSQAWAVCSPFPGDSERYQDFSSTGHFPKLDRPERSAYKGVRSHSACKQAFRKSIQMSIQFLLFVIAILLVSIFWVLSKINSLLKKALLREKKQDYDRAKEVA